MRVTGATIVVAVAVTLACADASRDDRPLVRDSAPAARAAPVAPRALVRDDGRGARRCIDIDGWLGDRTPGGRAVHADPSEGSRVLGRILEPLPEDKGGWPVGFVITGTRDGWLQVDHAGDDVQLTEGFERRMYAGSGWIRGEGVRVGVQATQAFAEPRHASEIVLTAASSLESLEFAAVVACDGKWVLGRWRIADPATVRYDARAVVSRDPLVVEGWATGICNIPETSCDQPSGDRPDSVRPDPVR
jgi:hypothetical protein